MKWSGGNSARFFVECRMRLVASALACLLVAASPAAAERLALLPIENQGDVPEAGTWLSPLMEAEIAFRGWDVVSGDSVEQWLAASRIRRMDSLSGEAREGLLDAFDAAGYLATTIFSFHTGNVPVITIGIRLVDRSGAELYGEVIGLSTEDIRGPLDVSPGDAIEPLVDRVLEQLFRGFPIAGKVERAGRPSGSPFKLHEPFTFLSAHLNAFESPYRVAILPFSSFVEERDAARIAAQLTARWMERASGFEPVEPADLRQALIAEGVRNAAALGPETMVSLGRRLGSTLFLRGTVYRWQREADTGSEVRSPEVEVNLTLIDAATSRILWSSQHGRRGEQYRGFLQLGAITNVVALADRVISEMVAAQIASRPIPVPPARPPDAPINGALKLPVRELKKGIDDS